MGTQRLRIRIAGQEVDQTGSVWNAEELVKAGAAQIRIDEQNFFSQLRERDGEICRYGSFSFATFSAGYQQGFGRMFRGGEQNGSAQFVECFGQGSVLSVSF